MTRGVFAYDYGDSVKMGPIAKMYTLGHDFVPSSIHAGGLRYHGLSPIMSQLYHDGLIEAQAYGQVDVLNAGVLFAKAEGIVPAPESTHAIKGAIEEALRCKREGKEEVILFNLSGHGYFDFFAYEKLMNGSLENDALSEENLKESLAKLPEIKE